MGSAGKESREVEMRKVSNLDEADQLEVIIKWRDDGDIFATSVPTSQGRRVRIYSRDGNHLRLTRVFFEAFIENCVTI